MQLTDKTVAGTTRLILLRHGEVASHRGDVPVTPAGLDHAEHSGKALGHDIDGRFTVLFGGTRRTRETAEAIVRGIGVARTTPRPIDSFALRNPDLYLAGSRVNMVSSYAALAEQVPGMDQAQAEANPWWSGFITSADRIGWWLHHHNPPGDSGGQVAARVLQFATSLTDAGPWAEATVIGVTHSPVLRALLQHASGADPGEPAYVTGAEIRVAVGADPQINAFDPLDHC